MDVQKARNQKDCAFDTEEDSAAKPRIVQNRFNAMVFVLLTEENRKPVSSTAVIAAFGLEASVLYTEKIIVSQIAFRP